MLTAVATSFDTPPRRLPNEAALEIENDGDMKPARMGRGDGLWEGKQSRGDSILWITQGLRAAGELPEVSSLTAWQLLAKNS